jgi:hypothetical protein
MRLPFEKSRTHLLLSELESAQTTHKYYLTKNDLLIISAKRKSRRNKQFKQYLVLGLMIKFIGCDLTLANLLVLNKESRLAISQTVYKSSSDQNNLNLADIAPTGFKQNTSDYNAFKLKVIKNPHLISNVEEVIILDMLRSSHSMPNLDMEALINILNTTKVRITWLDSC